MRRKVVLISCVSKKLTHCAEARDLYTSTLFRYNLKYAKQLKPDGIYVLSAKHGLLKLDQEIEPYNITLNTMRVKKMKEWASTVIGQMKEICPADDCEYIYLAGERYRRYLLPYTKHYSIPLKGLGIGKQLQKLKELTS